MAEKSFLSILIFLSNSFLCASISFCSVLRLLYLENT